WVLALLLALLGATAAWLCFPSPVAMPSFLGGWIDQYKDPIPVNAWAPEDREALEKKPRWERINAFPSQVRALLKQVLHNLRQEGEKPVVVFLSAYAVALPDGTVHLLPADANLEKPGTWLPLVDVLRDLRACPSRHKLLILDLMRPFTDAKLGLL